jgi:hypothetical protein
MTTNIVTLDLPAIEIRSIERPTPYVRSGARQRLGAARLDTPSESLYLAVPENVALGLGCRGISRAVAGFVDRATMLLSKAAADRIVCRRFESCDPDQGYRFGWVYEGL